MRRCTELLKTLLQKNYWKKVRLREEENAIKECNRQQCQPLEGLKKVREV